MTWVQSGSGVKLPIREIGKLVRELNQKRDEQDRIIYVVDGVHGFGVEDVSFADFDCDYFIAGTHKWLFGPRGTGSSSPARNSSRSTWCRASRPSPAPTTSAP